MYVPAAFREDDLTQLHAFMREHEFAILISVIDGVPFATHLPVLLDPDRGPFGTIRAHVARANPHWRAFEGGAEALAIFQGPHGYISPSKYEAQPSVPTWNYTAVHAYGAPRVLDDDAFHEFLMKLTRRYEGEAEGWKFDMPDAYVRTMMRGIVGFEIEITRIEGKFKLSQNRSESDRSRVIEALQSSDSLRDRELAESMRRSGTARFDERQFDNAMVELMTGST